MGELARHPRVTVHADAASLPGGLAPGTVVLAVKPQSMDGALVPLKRFVAPGTCFLSIAAGKTLGYFAAHLGAAAAVVRAMPNTPAAVGRGIRSEEHTSELQSLMRISYAVFCLKKKNQHNTKTQPHKTVHTTDSQLNKHQ